MKWVGQASPPACCAKCNGKVFCSTSSGNCYDSKTKPYYSACEASPTASPDAKDETTTTTTIVEEPEAEAKCCDNCGGTFPFCSPVSRNCYPEKKKDHYESCTTTTTTPCVGSECEVAEDECCDNCGGTYPFCSPDSGNCYPEKRKDYYGSCTTTTTTPCVGDACKILKVTSYNTEYRNYNARMAGYAKKIKDISPSVVGLQECQNRDGLASLSGYTANQETGTQNYMLFDPDQVKLLSGGYMRIPRDNYALRYITWGKFSRNGATFWFFNTHLPHNHGEARSQKTHAKIANMLLEKREELGAENSPTVVVGDTNSHASNFNKVDEGGFESNLQANGFTLAYTARGHSGGHGAIDHILYSAAHFTHKGCDDTRTGGSDHTSITCDLTFK